jgi:hypothetical protein
VVGDRDECPAGCDIDQRIEGMMDSIALLIAEDRDTRNPAWIKSYREFAADLRHALAGLETYSRVSGVLRKR